MLPSGGEITAVDHVKIGDGTALAYQAIVVASQEVGVRETAPNRGPMVDRFLISVGLDPTSGNYPWCAAFVFWVFEMASHQLRMANPCVKTASAIMHWQRAPQAGRIRVASDGTIVDPERVRPGCVFFQDHGAGKGHCGIVEGVDFAAGVIMTIDGNTNASGGREGDGVYRKVRPLRSVILRIMKPRSGPKLPMNRR